MLQYRLFSRNSFQSVEKTRKLRFHSAVWQNMKFSLNEKKFRQINCLEIFLLNVDFTKFLLKNRESEFLKFTLALSQCGKVLENAITLKNFP